MTRLPCQNVKFPLLSFSVLEKVSSFSRLGRQRDYSLHTHRHIRVHVYVCTHISSLLFVVTEIGETVTENVYTTKIHKYTSDRNLPSYSSLYGSPHHLVCSRINVTRNRSIVWLLNGVPY